MTLRATGGALPPETADYRDALVAEAMARKLHEDPYWLKLGHYRPRWFGGHKSMIDDPLFFCDPRGKYDPGAELAATIRAFFELPPDDPEARHPVCRFPARHAWLKEKLDFRAELFPVPECEIFDRVHGYMKPTSATLAFPAAYMNSPASMFGHTLLIFDGEGKNRLLSKGVGYAAAVTTGFGPVFALGGIFGMYPGRFAIESYYDKVETYNDIHRRDIWEYELALTPDEVEKMFRHTWELQNIWSWYYFFDENCAYKLYQLIDVARPGLDLSDDTSWFVIPLDTVKRIADKGLVREQTFRPSKATRMTLMAEQLTPSVRARALAVARGHESPETLAHDEGVPEADRRLALDLGADYTQFLFTEKLLDKDAYSRRFLGILRERSKLGPREEHEFEIDPPARPEEGHSASMLAPGVGFENGDYHISLSGRVAYHGLLDNDTGYARGAQILFLNTEARWHPDEDKLELRLADIVHVESISPRNDLFLPVSWRARLGFTQMDRREGQDGMLFRAQTGGGGAWELGKRHLVMTMIETEIHLSDRYEEYAAGGPGFSAGWIYTPVSWWKWLTQARTAWIYEGSEDWWRVEAGVGTDIRLGRNHSLRLKYDYTLNDDYNIREANVSWNVYF